MKFQNKERAGLFLLLVIIAINIAIALKYYNLNTITLDNFFFAQSQKNGLFDPNIRYD